MKSDETKKIKNEFNNFPTWGVLCERGEYFLSLMVIREKDKEIRIKDETLTRKSTAQDDTCGVR